MKSLSTLLESRNLSPGLRVFLYLTAAFTGASVMIVEILGAKMLAPYFGTSHFVWTAQIAITLVSLACGYYLGGWVADRSPQLDWLYRGLLLAAFFLALATRFCEPMCFQCLKLPMAAGSLLASLLLFFAPLTLLAVTAPFLVRMLANSLQGVGGQVGRLSAISTLGSVAGTVLIGYCLIPFFPNSTTMYLTALAQLALAAVFFLVWGREKSVPLAVALIFALVAIRSIQTPPRGSRVFSELARYNSNFGLMQVWQHPRDHRRYYLNDFLTQNTYDADRKQSTALFTYMLHGLARTYSTNIQSALCIGLGVGIVPMSFAREGVQVEVVEINPEVSRLAAQYFDLKPEAIHLNLADGRAFLNRCERQFDVVVLDAFLGDSSPTHLMSREAFASIKRVLNPNGVLVINSFCDFEEGKDFFCGSLDKTLRSVFPSVVIHDGGGNTFFVASPRAELKQAHEPNLAEVHPQCLDAVKRTYAAVRQANPNSGRILTDDFNPVEYYDAANRERLRRVLASSMEPD